MAQYDDLNARITALYGIVDTTNHAVDGIFANLSSINALLKEMAAQEAVQNPRIQKAIADADAALKAIETAPVMTEIEKKNVSWLTNVLNAIFNR